MHVSVESVNGEYDTVFNLLSFLLKLKEILYFKDNKRKVLKRNIHHHLCMKLYSWEIQLNDMRKMLTLKDKGKTS